MLLVHKAMEEGKEYEYIPNDPVESSHEPWQAVQVNTAFELPYQLYVMENHIADKFILPLTVAILLFIAIILYGRY